MMNPHSEYTNLLLFDMFCKESEIVHFSTTRQGGVSDGTFSSFNMGNFSDDSSLNIQENRRILARMFYMDTGKFIIPHQTHGAGVFCINADFFTLDHAEAIETLYGVDATITQERGIFLCVTTADCVPIILFDRKKKAVAAIHAGWRGTVERIVARTINEMKSQFGSSTEDMIAGIGPAISMHNYMVGDDVVDRFKEQGFDLGDSAVFSNSTSASKYYIDLKEINKRELLRLGIPMHSIEKSEMCTYEREDLFFSARRQTVHSGRMLTGIMIK